ncbi:HET-domain-containing protein [Podospora conica]|nr:HET-domain-containing protein [Schizothecium conicum]
MRLINCKTLALEEFFDSATPEYAILSHTWGDGEIRFQDMTAAAGSSDDYKHQGLPGFLKIKETCRLALERGLDWAWVDTCCIDKSSSAELTEAINSMFRWYQDADICFVFLSDLDQPSDLSGCRWFKRGWTLQELLAPTRMEFYDRTWTSVGTKESLLGHLSAITGIREEVLTGGTALGDLAVAEKMSWAADRNTTRPEDLAYCLFGIFDINMPLIYGESKNAFRRLQEEIIRRSNDLTIFAWEHNTDATWNHTLFATSPRDFTVYRDKFPNLTNMESHDLGLRGVLPEYTLTNSGLRLDAKLECQPYTVTGDFYFLKLGSLSTLSQPWNITLAITLVKIGAGLFLRRGRLLEAFIPEYYWSTSKMLEPTHAHPITIALADSHSMTVTRIKNLELSVNISPKGSAMVQVIDAIPEGLWDRTTWSFFCPHSRHYVSAALVKVSMKGALPDVSLLVIIDRRQQICPFLVGWTAADAKWKAWLFQERHAREPPTWDDLRYQIGDSVNSLSSTLALKPVDYDPDRSEIVATATLGRGGIGRGSFPSGTDLPQPVTPLYALVIEIARENGVGKTMEVTSS